MKAWGGLGTSPASDESLGRPGNESSADLKEVV